MVEVIAAMVVMMVAPVEVEAVVGEGEERF